MAAELVRGLLRKSRTFRAWQAMSSSFVRSVFCETLLWNDRVSKGLRSGSNRRATPHGRQPAGKSVPEMNKEKKVNSRNMIRVTALGFVCLLGTAAVRAQGTAAAGSATGTKVGVINVRQAIVATAEGKQASAELQSQFASRQNELEGLNKQVNDVRQQLAANQTTWSDEQKQRATVQGQRLAAQLERKNNELQEDVNAAQGEVIDRIGRKMMDVLDRYARENGYVAVLDSSSQNSPILYASSNIDMTQDIIKLYDQSYPVKAGAAPAAKPAAAPKPAAQPPATKPQP
jgi:outer membrane protein